MLNIFPSACYFFFQFSKKITLTWKNFYQANLENCINKILAWSESQLKLSSLVSWCADFTRWWPIQVMNHWRFGFFEEKSEDLNISCLALPPLPWWPGLDLPCVFESWPNTSCYGTSNWSNKRVNSVLSYLNQSEQRGLEFWASF